MKYQPPPKNTNTVKTVIPQNIKEDEAALKLNNHKSAPLPAPSFGAKKSSPF